MLPASPVVPTYRCPGDAYDIPHPVHVARLASGFARCRDCLHRYGRAAIDGEGESLTGEALTANESHSLFTNEGVRGVYLNELTRTEAGKIAGAFAACLWDDLASTVVDQPLEEVATDPISVGQPAIRDEGVVVLAPGRPGPAVVLAHDERPASPDLVMGVGVALRRMGCQVVDVGPATRPAFWFAVEHLQAAGGIHVTGSGCDAAWTGLDFVRRGATPCSRGAGLDAIETRYRNGYSRPSRRPGSQRLFTAGVAYEAGLGKHFHALRPLRIALGCPNRMLGGSLARLFRKSACRLLPVEIPMRARNFDDPRDPDVLRVAKAVRSMDAHFGILIDEDAQRCALVDNAGMRVAPLQVLSLLADREFEARGSGRVVWEGTVHPSPPAPTEIIPKTGKASLADMSLALRNPGVVCGADDSERYWFVESYPVCDAVLTLVNLLHVLSRSDTPFAEMLNSQATAPSALSRGFR